MWEGEGESAVATNVVSQTYLDLLSDTDGLPVDQGINAFAGALSAAIKAGTIKASDLESDSKPLDVSGEEGSTVRTGTFDTLTAGSYLVLINGGKLIYRPSIANLTPVVDGCQRNRRRL